MDYVPLLNAEYEMVRCENDSDLVNKLKRMDPKFGHVLIVKAEFDSPIRDIPVAPNVKRVSFIDSIIKNYNILQFDKWCPNVSELEFVRTKFGKNVNRPSLSLSHHKSIINGYNTDHTNFLFLYSH